MDDHVLELSRDYQDLMLYLGETAQFSAALQGIESLGFASSSSEVQTYGAQREISPAPVNMAHGFEIFPVAASFLLSLR
jgi:hypothetical protein